MEAPFVRNFISEARKEEIVLRQFSFRPLARGDVEKKRLKFNEQRQYFKWSVIENYEKI